MRRNHWTVLIAMVIGICLFFSDPARGAEAKRPPEWERTLEAAKKEGKIVLAIPPTNKLQKKIKIILKQKFNFKTKLITNPKPHNANQIATERKTGVRYFDALIVGTGTAVTLA